MLTAREKFFIASKRQKARAERDEKKRKRKESMLHSGGWDISLIPEGYLTVRQAADRYNRAESGIYKAISNGGLVSCKMGNYRIIKEDDLVSYFNDAKDTRRMALYRGMCARTGRPIPT